MAKCIWISGLSGSGKTTIGSALVEQLLAQNQKAVLLDGDILRQGLSLNLGFSMKERREHVRRTAEVAKILVENDIHAVATLISPKVEHRLLARGILPKGSFCEVNLVCSLEECIIRDVKGLYKKRIEYFTGIDSPYEYNPDSEIILNTETCNVYDCLDTILRKIKCQ